MITSFNMLKTMLVARATRNIESEKGATMVEYAIMVGLIAVVVLLVVFFLGRAIKDDFNGTRNCIESPGQSSCS